MFATSDRVEEAVGGYEARRWDLAVGDLVGFVVVSYRLVVDMAERDSGRMAVAPAVESPGTTAVDSTVDVTLATSQIANMILPTVAADVEVFADSTASAALLLFLATALVLVLVAPQNIRHVSPPWGRVKERSCLIVPTSVAV